MRILFAAWGIVLTALVGLPGRALAVPTTYGFSGTAIVCITNPPGCNGFGLPIATGDPFTGRFSFDDAEVPTDFRVTFPNISLVATDLTLTIHPYDGFLQFANLQGRLFDDVYMNIALAQSASFPIPLVLPIQWDCALWETCGFQIRGDSLWPVDHLTTQTATINTFLTGPGEPQTFEIHPIAATPEPSTLLLLGSGVLGVWWVRRRKPVAHLFCL